MPDASEWAATAGKVCRRGGRQRPASGEIGRKRRRLSAQEVAYAGHTMLARKLQWGSCPYRHNVATDPQPQEVKHEGLAR